MHVEGLGISEETSEVRFDVVSELGTTKVNYRLPEGRGAGRVDDAFASAALLVAMRQGESLRLGGEVSPRLRVGLGSIMDIFCTWDQALRPADRWYQQVELGRDAGPRGRGDAERDGHEARTWPDQVGPDVVRRETLAFFTGGVDSFNTALRHRHVLDGLVFVHGFDVALDNGPLRREVSARLQRAADSLGLALWEVESDVQSFGRAHGVPWPDYHGAALASVAHLLASAPLRVLVPSTHTYANLQGLGSHPLVDPLWSSEQVEIIHVDADMTRTDKIRAIANESAARDHLRVCWENPAGAYNCGTCEKCIRTGVAIRIAGVEGRFPTIAPPSLRQIANVVPTGRGSNWQDLRHDLVAAGGSPRLRRAIDVALARNQISRWRSSWPLGSR